ncbi:MAG: metallophosphoesterase [Peptococcales bacterium]|jgi:predicted phosphodiesterase
MEKIKASLFFAFGSIYLSEKLLSNPEPKVLHISDTPTVFYSSLAKIIKKLEPQYIIHTGDLVDNIKLDIRPNKLKEYQDGVYSLLNILEGSTAQKIYITPGNHDDLEIIEMASRRSIILTQNQVININNIEIKASHYHEDLVNSQVKYNLFGHDVVPKSSLNKGMLFLNGIESINIITLYSGHVFALPYPLGTNDARLGKFKFGI